MAKQKPAQAINLDEIDLDDDVDWGFLSSQAGLVRLKPAAKQERRDKGEAFTGAGRVRLMEPRTPDPRPVVVVTRNLRPREVFGHDRGMSDAAQDFQKANRAPIVLSGLLRKFVPVASDEDVEALERLIESARKNPPADPKGFVRDVNHLLEILDLRLRVDGEVLGKLRVVPGQQAREYIQFAVARTRGGRRGGTRGGFHRADVPVEVVRVDRTYSRSPSSPGP